MSAFFHFPLHLAVEGLLHDPLPDADIPVGKAHLAKRPLGPVYEIPFSALGDDLPLRGSQEKDRRAYGSGDVLPFREDEGQGGSEGLQIHGMGDHQQTPKITAEEAMLQVCSFLFLPGPAGTVESLLEDDPF